MANLQKRGGYTSRSVKQQRAYRMVVAGSTTGVLGVLGLVLAIAGVVGYFAPIVLLLLTAVFVWRFMTVTGQR
jgi:CHASE2 domain-containing sensor protein